LGIVVGALFVAVPANTRAEEGPADPILDARRSVLGFLRTVGIVDPPHFFGGGGYLPTVGGSEFGEDGPDGVYAVSQRMEIQREPVYRGVLWPVGDRIIYRTTLLGDYRSNRRALLLCYVENGTKFVVGESTVESGALDRSENCWEVRGYVPRSASGYWVEEIDENGGVRSLNGWGDVSEFWRR
jgi:hypothetical protein